MIIYEQKSYNLLKIHIFLRNKLILQEFNERQNSKIVVNYLLEEASSRAHLEFQIQLTKITNFLFVE
jgi:hypothetical protein